MNTHLLAEKLKTTFDDFRISKKEKTALKEYLRKEAAVPEKRAFIRNCAFDIATGHISKSDHHRHEAMEWLRQIIKLLDSHADTMDSRSESAWFSPGPDCATQIIDHIRNAGHFIDVCVFTISDNEISEQLYHAHQKGIRVRIITDDDKTRDVGSDVFSLHRAGIPVKIDNDPSHMHHKFAIFDRRRVINGSFNWTRSASTRNHEDITVTNHSRTVKQFCQRFDLLWQQFFPLAD